MHFAAGRAKLLAGDGYQALDEICLGIRACQSVAPLEGALSHDAASGEEGPPRSAEGKWVYRLLLVARAAFSMDQDEAAVRQALRPLRPVASMEISDRLKTGPVVLVAGGCDASVSQRIMSYELVMALAFQEFQGTVICGGNRSGIAGLIGGLRCDAEKLWKLGYLPQEVPEAYAEDGIPHPKYTIRWTEGDDFTPLEAISTWVDLLVAGRHPREIKLIGINGGTISALEYRMALALGAGVAVLGDSGRAASELINDETWGTAHRFSSLPTDAAWIRKFLQR